MSYQRLIIPLLILSLFLTLSGCGGSGITPALPDSQEKGIIYLEPANLNLTPTSSALILGDFGGINNGPSDGVVDFEDLMIFAMAYGSNPSDSNWNPVCDIAGPDGKLTPDGVIDFEDLMVFAMNYGEEETVVPDYTQGLSWAGAVEFDGEPYLKGGETYDFVLAFDYVITDPELRYIKIKDYSNPATPGIIFYEFMTLADLATDDDKVFFGEFTPPSICDSGGSGLRPKYTNGEEGGEYCTPAYVEVYGLGANCCAPSRYKFNVDATLPKAEIKITTVDYCGETFLEFDTIPSTCDGGYCCGDECTELVRWSIDIFDTMPPIYYCGELIIEEKYHFEGEGCPVRVEMTESGWSASKTDIQHLYWIITTLEDKVGNLNHYYVDTYKTSLEPYDLVTVEYYGFNPDFWVWDGSEADSPFKDYYTIKVVNNIYGDPCPWEVLDCQEYPDQY